MHVRFEQVFHRLGLNLWTFIQWDMSFCKTIKLELINFFSVAIGFMIALYLFSI